MKLNNFPGRASIQRDPRHGTYYLDFRDHGRRVRIALNTKDPKQAKLTARMKWSDYFSSARAKQDLSPEEFSSMYFEWSSSLKDKETVRLERLAWRYFLEVRAPRLMSQYEKADADRFISSISKTHAPTSVSMLVRALRTMFFKAIEWGCIAENIFSRPRLPAIQEELPRILTRAEQDSIFRVCRERYPDFVDVFLVYLNTGLRRIELLQLLWTDVMFDLGSIAIRRAKGRKARTVPMLPTVREILQRRQHLERPFAYSISRVDHTFLRCVRYAFRENDRQALSDVDTRGITLHSLRKTFCSYLASKNVPPEATMRIMGHASLAVTMRYYSNVSLDMLRGRFGDVDAALNRSDQTQTKVEPMGLDGNGWEPEGAT